MPIIHSYINQPAVYSPVYRCHIYPSTFPAQPFIVEPDPTDDDPVWRLLNDYFTQHGPAQTRVIADTLDLPPGLIGSVLNNKRCVLFHKVDAIHHVWGLLSQSIDDIEGPIYPTLEQRVINRLQSAGPATTAQLAEALRVDKHNVTQAVRRRSDEIVNMQKCGMAAIWRLKEVASSR